MIDNINSNQVGHLLGQPALPNAEAAAQKPKSDADAALQVSFGDLINQAKQATTDDSQAVAEARELLQSGRLTSPENIEAAAKNILNFGI